MRGGVIEPSGFIDPEETENLHSFGSHDAAERIGVVSGHLQSERTRLPHLSGSYNSHIHLLSGPFNPPPPHTHLLSLGANRRN